MKTELELLAERCEQHSQEGMMSSEIVKRLRVERDTAQSLVEAWASVVEALEAHIMDRAENDDPASPATYLSILRADVAGVLRDSEQVRAARWADHKRQSERVEQLEREVARKDEALSDGVATLAAVRATSRSGEWSAAASHFHDVCGETIVRLNAALQQKNDE